MFGPYSKSLRDVAAPLSAKICVRVAPVTQTKSLAKASRHTNPSLHALGPNGLLTFLDAAAALSTITWAAETALTHTVSVAVAARFTNPVLQVPAARVVGGVVVGGVVAAGVVTAGVVAAGVVAAGGFDVVGAGATVTGCGGWVSAPVAPKVAV